MPPSPPAVASRTSARGEGGHVPALDGIRGLAIALVIVFHCTHYASRLTIDWVMSTLFVSGWVGVDLFFVLSGYLITGILLDQKGSPHYLRNFYARRVLRIFPLYYAVLALSIYALPHLLPPDKLARFGKATGDAAYYWLYLSNFAIARAGEFRHAVLDVSWSLAIEEQFYLLWPALCLFTSRRGLLRVAIGLGLGSLLLRIVLRLALGASPHAVYVLTPTRMDGLAVGAIIAILSREAGGIAALRPAARKVLPAAGALMAASLIHEFWVTRDVVTPGMTPLLGTVGFTFVALTFGALLVLVVTAPAESRLARFFGSRLMRTFGTYSYGMYLFHLPVRAVIRDLVYGPSWSNARIKFPIFFGSELIGQLLFFAVALAAVLGVAWVSHQVFEKRFLDLKRFFTA